MRTVPLNEVGTVVLDASGNGTVQMRPGGPQQLWHPATVGPKVSYGAAGPTNEATCIIYSGQSPTDPYYVDQTFTGSSGDNSDRIAGHIIGRTREPYLWAKWTGGDPHATATLTVIGTMDIP